MAKVKFTMRLTSEGYELVQGKWPNRDGQLWNGYALIEVGPKAGTKKECQAAGTQESLSIQPSTGGGVTMPAKAFYACEQCGAVKLLEAKVSYTEYCATQKNRNRTCQGRMLLIDPAALNAILRGW